jgi:hypothetical protein
VHPAFSFGLSRPLHRRLVGSESLLHHRSDRPKFANGSLHLEVHRRCFTAVFFDLIFKVLPFVKGGQSNSLDRGDVDEHVFAPCLRLNESIALVGLNHFTTPRAIVNLPANDPHDIILIGGLAANAATELCTSGFRCSMLGSIECWLGSRPAGAAKN